MKPLVFVFFFIGVTNAFYFRGEPFFAVSKIGDTLTQTQKIAGVCEDFDLGTTVVRHVLRANGTTTPVYFECPNIEFRGTVEIMGYVPMDGRLFVQKSCEWRDQANGASTDEHLKLEQGVISGTSLQHVAHNPTLVKNIWLTDFHRSKLFGSKEDQAKHKNRNVQLQGFGRNDNKKNNKHFELQGLGGLECAVLAPICTAQNAARLDKLEEGLDDVRKNVSNLAAALADQQRAMEASNAQNLRTLSSISVLANNTFLIAQANTQAIKKQGVAIEASKNATELLARSLTKDVGNIRATLITQGAAIQQLVASVSSIADGATQNIVYQMNNITARFTDQMNYLAGNQTADRLVSERMFAAIVEALRRFKGIFESTVYQNFKRRQLAFLTQSVMTAVDEGGIYRPFIDDRGLAANPNSPFAHRALVEQISIKSATGVEGAISTRVHLVNIYCSTKQALDNDFSFLTMENFLKAMGSNCIASANASVTCLCWATIQQTVCDTNQTKVTRGVWYNTGFLNTSVDCTSAPVTASEITYINPTLFVNALYGICQYGVYNALPHVISSQQGLMTINTTYDSVGCASPIDFTNSLMVGHGTTLASVVSRMVLDGFRVLRAAAYQYERIVYGEIPNNSTYHWVPFVRDGDQLGNCYYLAFMGYTPERVGVYRINLDNNPTGFVRVRVPGTPTANISQQDINVPSSFHLDDHFVTIGNPVDNSQQYDIPTSELPLVEVSSGRWGKVTYALSPNSTDNITAWNRRNGVDFDHFAGNNVASFYTVDLDVNGRCTGTRRAGSGSWCSLRDKFNIYSLGAGVIGFRPLQAASISFIADIPEGTIVDIVSSKCPAFNVEATSAQGVTLVLVNAGATDNTNQVVITGACSQTLSNVVTPAQGSKRIWIPACNPTFQEAHIFKINDDLSLTACNTNISVATNRAVYLGVQANADVRLVNETGTDHVDRLSIWQMGLQSDFTTLVSRLMQGVMQTFTNNAIQVPPSALQIFNANSAILNSTMDDLAAQLAFWRQRAPTDYSNLTSQYTNIIDAQLASARGDISTATSEIQKHAALAANLESNLHNLSVAFAVEANKTKAVVAAAEGLANAFAALTTNTNGFGGGEIFSGLGTLFKSIGNAGADLASDVWHGVKTAASDIYNGVKEVVKDALGLAEGLLSGLGGFIFFIIGLVGTAVALGALGWSIALQNQMKELKQRVDQMQMMMALNPRAAAPEHVVDIGSGLGPPTKPAPPSGPYPNVGYAPLSTPTSGATVAPAPPYVYNPTPAAFPPKPPAPTSLPKLPPTSAMGNNLPVS